MTGSMICFYCLTDDNEQVAAVTMHNGTAVCEKCAREWAEQIEAERVQVPDFDAGMNPTGI